uniref:SCP domain-containing protein n=1 Tax=Ascaris lumbricoides TaxID=6252 RepID=A0A9J2PXA0_ASCLU
MRSVVSFPRSSIAKMSNLWNSLYTDRVANERRFGSGIKQMKNSALANIHQAQRYLLRHNDKNIRKGRTLHFDGRPCQH